MVEFEIAWDLNSWLEASRVRIEATDKYSTLSKIDELSSIRAKPFILIAAET
jgi:hypothetical protein